MKHLFLALAVCTLAVACRSSAAADEGIPFRTLARGYHSGLVEDGLEVVRDEPTWRALWDEHAAIALPRPAPPEVDFDREMVVCLTMGAQPTAGYGITIVRVTPHDGGLYVESLETTPNVGAMVPQVVSHPFHMIAVPRQEGVVTNRTGTHGPNTP
jgi:hypothetical protein